MNKNIAILVGGESVERTISIKSGENFFENLDTTKYSGFLILVNNLDDDFFCLKNQIKIDKSDFSLEKNGKKISHFFQTILTFFGNYLFI